MKNVKDFLDEAASFLEKAQDLINEVTECECLADYSFVRLCGVTSELVDIIKTVKDAGVFYEKQNKKN